MTRRFHHGDVLLVIDPQRDFFEGGAMPVPDAEAIVPIINDWVEAARAAGIPVLVTRDWHPEHHVSFMENGGTKPRHCVQNTPGAEFHPELQLPWDAVIIEKGTDPKVDPESAFDDTDLEARLRDAGARRLWIAGLALDDTVRATALKALRRDYEVAIIAPATRARQTTHPTNGAGVLEELQQAGAFVGGRHAPPPPAS